MAVAGTGFAAAETDVVTIPRAAGALEWEWAAMTVEEATRAGVAMAMAGGWELVMDLAIGMAAVVTALPAVLPGAQPHETHRAWHRR